MTARDRKAALKVAHELREKFSAGGEFLEADFREALLEKLKDFKSIAYEGFVANIADSVDAAVTSERVMEQRGLFPDFDLDGEYRLGNGRRVKKTLALIDHLDEVLANDEENIEAIMRASARKHREIAKLRPYLRQPGTTKEQAVAAYRREHPEEEVA